MGSGTDEPTLGLLGRSSSLDTVFTPGPEAGEKSRPNHQNFQQNDFESLSPLSVSPASGSPIESTPFPFLAGGPLDRQRSTGAEDSRGSEFPWNERPSFEPFSTKEDGFDQESKTFYDRLLGWDQDGGHALGPQEQKRTGLDVNAPHFTRHAPIGSSGSTSTSTATSLLGSPVQPSVQTESHPQGVDVFAGQCGSPPSAKPWPDFQGAVSFTPTRIVLIEGLPRQVTAETVGHIASMYGTVRRLYKPRQWPGTAICVFFDIRNSELCCNEFKSHWQGITGTMSGELPVRVRYGTPGLLSSFAKADKDEIYAIMENDGIVFVLEDQSSPIRLQALLGEMGEIHRLIRDTSKYNTWTLVEFFDTRAAEACRTSLARLGIKASFAGPESSGRLQAPWTDTLMGQVAQPVPERPPLRHSISFSDGFSSISQQRVATPKQKDLQRAIFERKPGQDDSASNRSLKAGLMAAGFDRRAITPPSTSVPGLERSFSYSGEPLGVQRDIPAPALPTPVVEEPLDTLGQSLNDPFRSIAKFLGPDIDPRKLKAPPGGTNAGNNPYPVMQGKRSPPSKGCAESPSSLPKTIPASNVVDMWRLVSGEERRTTIMVRNVPNKYTQSQFLDLLNETHYGEYSFVYLRIDYVNKCNTGYAFVDFPNPSSIVTFAHRIVGKKWPLYMSDKLATVSWANVQGKASLIEKFRNSSVMIEDIPAEYKPKLFFTDGPLKGQEEPFPPPTIGTPAGRQLQHGYADLEEEDYESVFSFNNLRMGE